MTLDVKESEIVEAVYESKHTWVSVETKLNYELDPSVLFHITEDFAGDRFYFKKMTTKLHSLAIMLLKDLKMILKINNLFSENGKNIKVILI